MGMTIKELAAELGVSKEAIRKHVAKLPSDHVSHGKRGVIYLTDEATNIVRQQVAANKTLTNNQKTTTDNRKNDDDIGVVARNGLTTDNQLLQTELQTELQIANAKIQLLSDNLNDLRATIERQATELQAKEKYIAELLQSQSSETERKDKQITDLLQALQAEQILHGQMLQLEPPKRKWYEVFKSKKGSEQK